jgi:citrate lyase subunit beta/citryl-CoA lyase
MQKSFAGQHGPKVRSDCYFEIEETNSGGIKIELKSKVDVMYGNSIKSMISEMCKYFNLKNANILCEDSGALPFTISARFESTIKRLKSEITLEYLLPMNKNNLTSTTKDRLRRSRLYLPGNEPKFYPNAGLHSPDGIILDLEDSVAPAEKDNAQLIVRNALRSINFYSAEKMVRINQLPKGLDDLKFVIPHNVNVILIPKCESKELVLEVEEKIKEIESTNKISNEVFFMPIIESALGVEKSFEIATASQNNCALAVGLEDYTADIGTQRSAEGTESFYARSQIINAAKAAKIQAIDTVFSDINDMDGLRRSILEAKQLGFEGKGCIHPRQIKVINETFLPEAKEIDKAKKIVLAFDEAKQKGLGVVALGSKMIDAPIVKRAEKTIKLAVENNLLDKNWKSNEIN